jgi:hypothetical protein
LRCSLVAPSLHEQVENLAFVINRLGLGFAVRHPFESHTTNLGLFSYALAKTRGLIVAAEP